MKYFARLFFTLFFLLSYIPSYSYERRKFSETINKDNQNLVGNLLASKENKLKEVIVVGVGETIDKASQNAANNALNQVAGSFLDSEKIFSKNSTLNREKININKSFIKNNYSYAPGSINSFEIIETNKEDLLYYVIAKVEVKLNELGTFYKEDLQNKSSILISDLETKKIYSNGKGSTLDNAIYNAKLNALNQVIGTYLTSELIIKNQKSIREGVVEKLKSFSNKKKSYTQGFIKSYEIKNTMQIGILYEVEGIFEIRLSELNSYIKKIAYGSNEISRGIFFNIATDIKNNESKFDLLYEKVLSPLFKGEVLEIDVDKPFIYQSFCDKEGKSGFTYGLGVMLNKNQDKILISKIFDNSPASKKRLKKGDYILSINNKLSSEFINTEEVLAAIPDEDDVQVELLIQRGKDILKKTIKTGKFRYERHPICKEGYFEKIDNRRPYSRFQIGPKTPFDRNRTIVIWVDISLNDDYLKNIKNILENISSKKEIKRLYTDNPYRNSYAMDRDKRSDLMLSLQDEAFDNDVTRFYISDINQNNFRQFRNKCKDHYSYSPYNNHFNSTVCLIEAKKRQAVFGDLRDPYNVISIDRTLKPMEFNFLDRNRNIVGGFVLDVENNIGCSRYSKCLANKVSIDASYKNVGYVHLYNPRTKTIVRDQNLILFMDLELETLKKISTIEIQPRQKNNND